MRHLMAYIGLSGTMALMGYLYGVSSGSELGYDMALERMQAEVKAQCPAWFTKVQTNRKPVRACYEFTFMK